jgi:hypothetical protein
MAATKLMKILQRFSVIISLITFIAFFAGCAQTQDGRNTQMQGTAIGAVGGALVGGLLGYAVGGRDGAVRGAIAGAAVGGTAGFAYGTHVARQKAKYASAERWLDACIADARKANQQAYAYNDQLSKRVAALESRAKAAMASGNRSELRRVKSEIATLEKQANGQQRQIGMFMDEQKNVTGDPAARSQAGYSEYQKELSDMNKANAGITRNLSRLASLDNQVNL